VIDVNINWKECDLRKSEREALERVSELEKILEVVLAEDFCAGRVDCYEDPDGITCPECRLQYAATAFKEVKSMTQEKLKSAKREKIDPEIHAVFQTLWTKAVGTKDYVKAERGKLERYIYKDKEI
jgi:hypothetical protein